MGLQAIATLDQCTIEKTSRLLQLVDCEIYARVFRGDLSTLLIDGRGHRRLLRPRRLRRFLTCRDHSSCADTGARIDPGMKRCRCSSLSAVMHHEFMIQWSAMSAGRVRSPRQQGHPLPGQDPWTRSRNSTPRPPPTPRPVAERHRATRPESAAYQPARIRSDADHQAA